MIYLVNDYDLTMRQDGDTIIISGIFNLDGGNVHNVCYLVAYDDLKEFVEGDAPNIIANNDTVYIYFFRLHMIVEEEMESEKLQFGIDDSTDIFNMIVSWWWNH